MARTKNKTTNPVLYWKPNQFPSARFNSVQWDPTSVGHVKDKEASDSETNTPAEDAERIDYLKNRFKSNESQATNCPSGPSGCCPS